MSESSTNQRRHDFRSPSLLHVGLTPRRWLALQWLIALALCVSDVRLQAEESSPNIVLIVVDDLGWADLGCYGSQFHKTPHIDRLAADGIKFSQAYAAAPVGAPTRAALLTGRYPQRFHLTGSFASPASDDEHLVRSPKVSRQLPLSEITLAEALKSAGYATGCIGKWHLGGAGFGPREQGFDVSVAGDATSTQYNDVAPYTDSDGNRIPGLEDAPAGEYLTDRLTSEAQAFIAQHKSKPFFLYLPHFAVHLPATAKPELLAKYGPTPTAPTGKQINPTYAAVLEDLDDAIGRVVKTLDDLRLSDRTILVLTSDNGGVCNGRGQIVPPTSNAPLRDGMGHLYEGGLRVPLIAKWPNVVKPGSTSNQVVSCLDLFPTIAELQSLSRDSLDGVSLLPILRGRGTIEREALYWHYPLYNINAGSRPGAAIRAGDWKLVEFYETDRRELFNVAREPGESHNLIQQETELAEQLAVKLSTWRRSVGALLPTVNHEFAPNPQGADGRIELPASTAEVFGIMLRYEPLPNKDTLGYWVREEDWARFEFTVSVPGEFQIVADVGCGTAGGSLVEFEVDSQVLSLTVPPTGHFQNFVPQKLGTFKLEKRGRYLLTVKPRKKEGVAVMDLRRIVLTPTVNSKGK